MIEGSAALFLLALFYLVERGFTYRVTTMVARQVHDDVVAPLESRVDALAVNIANLQEAVDQRRSEQVRRHHGLVSQLDQPTFNSVTTTLAEAARLNAIEGGTITVQANADPNGIWLTFGWGAFHLDGVQVEPNQLRITVAIANKSRRPRQIVDVVWAEQESVVDVAQKLSDKLRQVGARHVSLQPDWSLTMENLQRSLAVALPADEEQWHTQGPLYELVGSDWAITKAGVEHRTLGVVLTASEFPRTTFPPGPGRQLGEPPEWDPEAPPGIDPDEWRLVVDRSQARLTRLGYAMERGVAFESPSIKTWYPAGRQPRKRAD